MYETDNIGEAFKFIHNALHNRTALSIWKYLKEITSLRKALYNFLLSNYISGLQNQRLKNTCRKER